MKTFVECSRVTIWVPTKEGKFCNVPNLNEIPGCRKGSSAVRSLIRGLHNMRYDIDDNYEYEVDSYQEDTSNGPEDAIHDSNLQIEKSCLTIKNENKKLSTSSNKEDFEQKLYKIFDEFKIMAKILRSCDNNFLQFIIHLENHRIEKLMIALYKNGIGSTVNTSVSVMPTSIHMEVASDDDNIRYPSNGLHPDDKPGPVERHKNGLDQRIRKFYKTIKSRIIVAVVVQRIRCGSMFTFDYAAYLFLASLIALLGLLMDSSVVIVASMLVSPVMGPILAIIFGCIVADTNLRNKGIKNAFISILICIGIGFLFGFILILVEKRLDQLFYHPISFDALITKEMLQRGNSHDIILNACIAMASGAAAAFSVLGENTSSMIGVAISASLLPPAVNTGFLCSVIVMYQNDPEEYKDVIFKGYNETDILDHGLIMKCEEHENNEDQILCNLESLAIVSLVLTLLNIVLIFLFGWITLWIKKVTPERVPQNFSNFWREDVKYHRISEKNGSPEDEIHQIIEEEARNQLGIEVSENYGLKTFRKTVIEKIEQDDDYRRISNVNWYASNINKQKQSGFKKIWCSIKTNKNTPKQSSIPEDSCQYLLSSKPNEDNQCPSRPTNLPNLDTKLYHQAELLIRRSKGNGYSSQVAIDIMDSFQSQNNVRER